MIRKIILVFAVYRIISFLTKDKAEGLGLTDNSGREVLDGKEFNHLFPEADNDTAVINAKTSIDNTLELITKIIKQYKHQTKKLSKALQKGDPYETLKAVFDFTHSHIAYTMDGRGTEQIRTPARTWKDRKQGVDCDCFTVFLGTILENLGIPYTKRVTSYGKRYQHIYIVAKTKGREVPLDPVIGVFDYEKPYTYKKDYEG